MDRLESLTLFVTAVDEGSLSAAARRLGLSASMAGKHVSRLEADLQVRLLQRNTRRLSLTEVGQAYYRRARRILEDVEEADREARDAQQAVRGVLRVAAPVTFGAMHLGEVVARYLDRFPEVTVETLLDDRYVDLLAENIDVAIRIGRLLDSDLVARKLAPCRMLFCASPAFLDRHGHPSTAEELRRMPRLAFSGAVSPGGWTVQDGEGRLVVIDGPLRLAANNSQMLLAAALAGAGVAFGPSFVFGEAIAAGHLIALLPDHRTAIFDIHALFPTARNLSGKVRHFIDLISKSFGAEPTWDRAPKKLSVSVG